MPKIDEIFVESIVKQLVTNPDAVTIDRVADEMGVLLTLNVDPRDMGIVIGPKGQHIDAIRTLLRIIGAQERAKVSLKLNDPSKSDRTYVERNQGY